MCRGSVAGAEALPADDPTLGVPPLLPGRGVPTPAVRCAATLCTAATKAMSMRGRTSSRSCGEAKMVAPSLRATDSAYLRQACAREVWTRVCTVGVASARWGP